MGKGTKIAGIGVGILALVVILGYGYQSSTELNMNSDEQKTSGVGADKWIQEEPLLPIPKTPEPPPKTSEPPPKTPEPSAPSTPQVSNSQECSGNAKCFSGIVTRVTDGDTINVDGIKIRFALASAPELDEFEGEEAKDLISTICPVGSNALVDEDDGQTQGSYGRIIAVVYCNNKNLNSELMDSGMGNLSLEFCSDSEFASSPWVQKYGCQFINEPVTSSEPQSVQKDCDPSYPDFCIPRSPPDLDCKDIPQKRFTVLPPDPHRFDGDKDGIGCESG